MIEPLIEVLPGHMRLFYTIPVLNYSMIFKASSRLGLLGGAL